MVANGTCDYSPERSALAWFEWIPRLECDSWHGGYRSGPCRQVGIQFSPFDSYYWGSLGTTTLVLTGLMVLIATLFAIGGLALCCCIRPKPGPRRPFFPIVFYLASLLGVAGIAMTALVDIKKFDQGVSTVLDVYNQSVTKLENVDSAGRSLNADITNGLPHLQNVIDSGTCVGKFATRQLQELKTALQQAQSSLGTIESSIEPVTQELERLDLTGLIQQYDAELILKAALFFPIGLALLALGLELLRFGCAKDGCISCVTKGLLGLACVLVTVSASGYFFVGLLLADFCDAPNANVGSALDHFVSGDTRSMIGYYAACNASTVAAQFTAELVTAQGYFSTANAVIATWTAICPASPDGKALLALLQDAWPTFQAQLLPLESCVPVEQLYCRGIGTGLCEGVAMGAAQSTVAQFAMFVFLLVAMSLAACVGREMRRPPPAGLIQEPLAPHVAAGLYDTRPLGGAYGDQYAPSSTARWADPGTTQLST